MYHSQCGILVLSTEVPCRRCTLKCILGQILSKSLRFQVNFKEISRKFQGNESRTVIGLFQEMNLCRFEQVTWGSGALRDLMTKTFVLRTVHLRANVTKNQVKFKFSGRSQKIDFSLFSSTYSP